jgi:hypothetical protein
MYQLTVNGVVTYHNFESAIEAITFIKSTGKAGTVKKMDTKPVQDNNVTVTCGWGNQTHKWQTTKSEAVAHGNTCPNHRDQVSVVDNSQQCRHGAESIEECNDCELYFVCDNCGNESLAFEYGGYDGCMHCE